MKSSLVFLSLLSLAVAGPLGTRDSSEDQCTCDYTCIQQVGPDCECQIRAKNDCYMSQLEAGIECPVPEVASICNVGKEGDGCDAFTSPPQPSCGPGLMCQPINSEISDIGGKCEKITVTINPQPTTGTEGDKCGAFTSPPQPDCGEGLTCVLENEQVPDLGGTCQKEEPKGEEGDKCETGPSTLPACGEGLVCENPATCINPDAPCPGTCKRASYFH